MAGKKVNIIMAKVTEFGHGSVNFTALLDIDNRGYAHFQKRSSSVEDDGFTSIYGIIKDVAEVDDYIYIIFKSLQSGSSVKIELIKEDDYRKRIFEDYENGCLLDSYSSYIRECKINKIVDYE